MIDFRLIKASIPADLAARYYGLSVNRKHMSCCPFHDDHHPSMLVTDHFHCFACGAHGDAIDLVAQLLNIPVNAAAEQIANDFQLASNKSNKHHSTELEIKANLIAQYKLAERAFYSDMCICERQLLSWKSLHAPVTPTDSWDPRFVAALTYLTDVTYLLDRFLAADAAEKVQILINNGGFINELKSKLQHHTI